MKLRELKREITKACEDGNGELLFNLTEELHRETGKVDHNDYTFKVYLSLLGPSRIDRGERYLDRNYGVTLPFLIIKSKNFSTSDKLHILTKLFNKYEFYLNTDINGGGNIISLTIWYEVHIPIYQLFLDKGADINYVSRQKTPYDLLKSRYDKNPGNSEYRQLIDFFQKKGATSGQYMKSLYVVDPTYIERAADRDLCNAINLRIINLLTDISIFAFFSYYYFWFL
jgi:hypothetical protein